MRHTIYAISLRHALHLYAAPAAAVPEPYVKVACCLTCYVPAPGPAAVCRFALPPGAPVAPGAVVTDLGEVSQLTLHGIGIRSDAQVMQAVFAALRAAACQAKLVSASEEGVSLCLPPAAATQIYDRLCLCLPLSPDAP